jgi:hypothetical protein
MANFYTEERLLALVGLISKPRFDPYLQACNGNISLAVDLYVWNQDLGASFYTPLAILEVALRNSLHHELTILFGTSWHRDSRFHKVGTTILNARSFTVPDKSARRPNTDILAQPAKLDEKLHAELRRRAGPILKPGVKLVPTTDDIVGGLDFGYWTSLLNRDVENSLYAAGLYKAFPHAPHTTRKKPDRAVIAQKLRDLRILRNRVMHHESLFHRKNIRGDIRGIVEVCRWIKPIAAEWIDHLSRMEDILKAAPIPVT